MPEDVGTAGALRAIAHHLTANDILVKSPPLEQLTLSFVPLHLFIVYVSTGSEW